MICDAYDSDDVASKKRGFREALRGALRGAWSRVLGLELVLELVLGLGLVVVFGLVATGCQQGVMGSLDVVPAWPGTLTGAANAPLRTITDGDSIDLIRPIQGGHVLFIGALVRSASGDHGTIRAELRRGEAEGGQPLATPGPIIVFEERSTVLQPLPAGVTPPSASPDWRQLTADISYLANIPACPNFLPVEIPDHTLYVQITYTDSRGNTGFASRKIVPRCTQTDTSLRNTCLCECRASYTIDRCFVYGDAGTVD